jgi:hypothetical protein
VSEITLSTDSLARRNDAVERVFTTENEASFLACDQ